MQKFSSNNPTNPNPPMAEVPASKNSPCYSQGENTPYAATDTIKTSNHPIRTVSRKEKRLAKKISKLENKLSEMNIHENTPYNKLAEQKHLLLKKNRHLKFAFVITVMFFICIIYFISVQLAIYYPANNAHRKYAKNYKQQALNYARELEDCYDELNLCYDAINESWYAREYYHNHNRYR